MTKYKVGDVVSVLFPFSDLQAQKRRPGLVLVSGDLDLVIARITTHPPRGKSDVPLAHWSEIGLPRPSTIRLAKLATVDERLVLHTIGHLHTTDAQTVANAWQQLTADIVIDLGK